MEKEEISIGEATKSRLIDATLRSISDNGFADTTTSTISSLANVSKATLHHYFNSKENLLYETMLHLLRLIGEQAQIRMTCSPTPRSKLTAIVECVSLSYADNPKEVSSAWFAFWAHADHMPMLGRLMTIYNRRLRSNLRHFLVRLFHDELPELENMDGHVERVADGIVALIHGTFVSLSIGEGKLTPSSAAGLIGEYVDMVVSSHKRYGAA